MNSNAMLGGYQVLDFTGEQGRFCAKLLADMGAEVVRVEKPGQPAPQNYASTGKHCLSLDIENLRGREILHSILKFSDILIENYPPDYLAGLGLSYNDLSRLYPGLIMASITPFGQTGPYRGYRASELVSSALGGEAYLCGEPGSPPLKPFGPIPSSVACLMAANGILLALRQRQSTGKGQHLDISIHECVAGTLDHTLVRYFSEGKIAERSGSLYWNQAFRIFPCRDGYILLSLFQQWETLVEWLDSEGLAADLKDPKWLEAAEREKNLDHIIYVLEQWTLTHTADELVEMGQLMRFPWAKVNSIPEVVENPQLNQRGYFIETRDPVSGRTYRFPGAPVKMSESPWLVNPAMPGTGDYNREIYQHRLGLTDAEIEELRREGVI